MHRHCKAPLREACSEHNGIPIYLLWIAAHHYPCLIWTHCPLLPNIAISCTFLSECLRRNNTVPDLLPGRIMAAFPSSPAVAWKRSSKKHWDSCVFRSCCSACPSIHPSITTYSCTVVALLLFLFCVPVFSLQTLSHPVVFFWLSHSTFPACLYQDCIVSPVYTSASVWRMIYPYMTHLLSYHAL